VSAVKVPSEATSPPLDFHAPAGAVNGCEMVLGRDLERGGAARAERGVARLDDNYGQTRRFKELVSHRRLQDEVLVVDLHLGLGERLLKTNEFQASVGVLGSAAEFPA
jgi:hypothetical protein